MKFGTVATFTGVLLGLAHAAAALELTLLDTWSDTFPATTTTWRVQASAPAEVGWQLVLGSATVDRGQRTVADAAQPIELPVRTPALRDGVPGQATLLITATAGGQSARLEHPVYLLPADPWSGLRAQLAAGPVRMFDPEGTLAPRLREAGAETALMRNPAALAALTNGLLLVSEGVSLRAQRGLVDALVRAAAGGTRVLLLAPVDGALPLPGHEGWAGLPRPAVRLEGVQALRQLDKRLDVVAWPGRPSALASACVLSADRRQPEATWSTGPDGWAWMDLDFREAGGGRLLAVGWAPVAAWDQGPAPRHILAALVRHVVE